MASIRLERLGKTFPGGCVALSDVNLEVNDGEFLVLVGPSGCGKSTALRLIAGLEQPTDGDILVDGQSIVSLAPAQRDVALVFQNYALYPNLTGEENLIFGLKKRGLPKDEVADRIRNVAEMLSITDLLPRYPDAMSGGERQRIAVGRAMVRRPKALLFDEPLSNLDAQLRVHLRTELRRLHNQSPRTTIYVTHDQVEAMTLGDRVAVMRDGQLQQIDTPARIYEAPANRFVAEFIGQPAMNFIEGQMQGGRFVAAGIALEVGPLLDSNVQRVTLGLRPEALAFDQGTPLASGNVEVVEYLGPQSLVHVRTQDGLALIVRVEGKSTLQIGNTVSVGYEADAMHWFSADETGVRLA